MMMLLICSALVPTAVMMHMMLPTLLRFGAAHGNVAHDASDFLRCFGAARGSDSHDASDSLDSFGAARSNDAPDASDCLLPLVLPVATMLMMLPIGLLWCRPRQR